MPPIEITDERLNEVDVSREEFDQLSATEQKALADPDTHDDSQVRDMTVADDGEGAGDESALR